MKAILLVRISSVAQELESQTYDLIRYAKNLGYKEKNIITVKNIESAITLAEEERLGLNEMKDLIQKDKSINAVFVWELSRLTRNPITAYSLQKYFLEVNVQLYCYSPPFQLLDDSLSKYHSGGIQSFGFYITMAQAEMINKKERFHRAKIRNAHNAKFSGGFVKFGYYIDKNGYYQIDDRKNENGESNADLIRYVFNRYEQGISIFKLQTELMERGKTRSTSFVSEILKSEEYTGEFTGEFATEKFIEKNKKLNRKYPQIISREQFIRCKKIAKENNKKADKANEVYMAYKLIKCVECGGTYIGMKSTIQYLCYNRYGKESRIKRELAKKNPEKANEILKEVCKDSIGININILDTVLWNACKGLEVKYRTQNLKQMQDELNDKIIANNEKIAKCKKDIIDEQNEMDRINILFQKGRISEKASDENYNTCLKNIKGHNNKISDLESTDLLYTEKIKELSNTSTTIEDIRKLHEGLYASDDVIEKQEIIKRHVNYINIISETPNKTKLIKIYFHVFKNPMVYRIHYKKKPQIIEYDVRGAYAEPPYQFSKVGFEIVKRFITKNGKTVTVN